MPKNSDIFSASPHNEPEIICGADLASLASGDDSNMQANTSRQDYADNDKVLHFLQEIRPFSSSWSILYFHLSHLNATHQTHSSLQDSKAFVEKQAQGHLARSFILSNNDILLCVQNMGPLKVERVVGALRQFLAHDPLTKKHLDRDDFYHHFGLNHKFDWLFEKVQKLSMKKTSLDLHDHVPIEEVSMLPFDLMVKLQHTLRQADLSNFIRKQYMCWVDKLDTPVKPLGCEYYVSMESLEDVLQSQSHLITDFALFKYLSILFDKKMLKSLSSRAKRLDHRQHFHVNLNLRTVVSKEFFEFHTTIQRECVIEIDRTDLLWDLEGFHFASDFLKSHGHKVCVDLLFGANMALFKNLSLDCDYYKIVATPDMLENYASDVEEFIDCVGAERVIFVRCDTLQSIDFGLSHGVKQFQGFLLDKALRQPNLPLHHITL